MQRTELKRHIPLSSQAYDLIRKAISIGDLVPGERITERSLAEKLTVSPTPIREALKRLEHEGLIERDGQKSIVISDKSEMAIAEIAYIESVLLGIAARFAAEKITEAELGEIQHLYDTALEKMDIATGEELLEMARSFHTIINRACHNEVLARFLETVETFDRSHRLQSLNAEIQYQTDHLKNSLREHRLIFEALKARDGERADQLMVEHSLRTSRVFFKHLNNKTKFG
jgi:DNA-binding GntR family transcriptional regulator